MKNEMNSNFLCIYHAKCADGFASAWVVRTALGSSCFHAAAYGDAPPDVAGKDIILVDFSYRRQVLLDMAKTANSILILDHHKTAKEDLVELPDNVSAHFDMERSGAMLSWEYFFPDEDPPPLLNHIQDRDLWRFQVDGTKEIMAAIFSYPYDFEVWGRLMKADLTHLFLEGAAIYRKQQKDIDEAIAAGRYRTNIAGKDVPVLNAPPIWASEAGHIMGASEPFAACYWDTDEYRHFSLRSAEDGLDVSEIAKLYGGGGHRHAAGFRIRHHELDILNQPTGEK